MKHHFLIVDTETTMTGKIADFGAVLCDRKGSTIQRLGVLIDSVMFKESLFYNDSLEWSSLNLEKRNRAYQDMLENGSRFFASVAGINRWLAQIALNYRPILTAYNLNFDLLAMQKTGVMSDIFPARFCLWAASSQLFAHKRKYRQHVIDSHSFTNRTKSGNMAIKTDCEAMAKFCGAKSPEPHTALEDAEFEIVILQKLLNTTSTKKLLQYSLPRDWRTLQVRDWFKPK